MNEVLEVLPFCRVGSMNRTTPLPSTLTSVLAALQVSLPLNLLETTPRRVRGSSPLLMLISESERATALPSILVLVLPFDSIESDAELTKGVGMGPPGEGTLQTSGGAAMWVLPSPACRIERPL